MSSRTVNILLHSMQRDRTSRRLPEDTLRAGPRTRQSAMLGMQRRTNKKWEVCIVADCKTFIRDENLSETQRNQPNRPLVCEICLERGHTIKDTTTYTCISCKKSGGRGFFQVKDFQRAVSAGKQKCKTCSDVKTA